MDLQGIYTEVARHIRMDVNSAADVADMTFWINRAQDDVQNYKPTWWFLRDNYTITVGAGQSYPFPSVNADGATSVMSLMDLNSMRTAKRPLPYVLTDDLDANDEDWLSSTGSPRTFTIIGTNIFLEKAPSATWQTDNPTLFFRGWKKMAELSDDTDESVIPVEWRNILIDGALWRGWSERGVSDWSVMRESFYDKLSLMDRASRSGRPTARRPRPPRVFALYNRRGSNVRF